MKITINNIDDVFKSKLVSVETMQLKGYKLLEELFVDSSGFGAEDEPAYTIDAFKNRLIEILKDHPVIYTTITNAGQFQVYVGIFLKDSNLSNSRIIAGNTLLIDNKIIRYYDTNILEQLPDNKIKVDNGGYSTRSTNDRLNKYLPDCYRVFNKNGQAYIQKDNKKPILIDNTIISGNLNVYNF